MSIQPSRRGWRGFQVALGSERFEWNGAAHVIPSHAWCLRLGARWDRWFPIVVTWISRESPQVWRISAETLREVSNQESRPE